MKTILFSFFLLLISVNQLFAQNIKIKGSDTVLPLTQLLAEEFMKRNMDASVVISGGGSVTGISALLAGTTDIAQSARELTPEEKLHFTQLNKLVTETIIAYDALAIIVNPANKVSQLTLEQLVAVFTGKITNWKELGGANMQIVVYSREKSSGTYEFIKDHILNGKEFTGKALLMPATGAVAQSVNQVEGAIGYVGLAYLDKTSNALQISNNNGATFTAPSAENVKNKSYPISRPLYYIYPDSLKDLISPFIDYALSKTGQQLVEKTGYVPVK
jgi:phosphate transport system substrate-binding protein